MPQRELFTDERPLLLRRWALEQFETEHTIHKQRVAATSLTVDRWRRYAPRSALDDAPAAEHIRAAGLQVAQVAAESPGDRRLRHFLEALRKLDEVFPRSPFQRKVHHSMMASALPHIYGDDFVPNMARIFQKFGIDSLNLWGLIACPRRYGKTMAVAMAMAAFIATQPGKKVCIYSPSRRASRMMLATIFNMVKIIRGDSSDIVAMNQEELSLRHADGAISTCNSYPSNVRVNLTISPNCRRKENKNRQNTYTGYATVTARFATSAQFLFVFRVSLKKETGWRRWPSGCKTCSRRWRLASRNASNSTAAGKRQTSAGTRSSTTCWPTFKTAAQCTLRNAA